MSFVVLLNSGAFTQLRAEAGGGSDFGKHLNELMKSGQLIPSVRTESIVFDLCEYFFMRKSGNHAGSAEDINGEDGPRWWRQRLPS